MNRIPVALFELSLEEQEARNAAALAAIRSRAGDIAEAQLLIEALGARGLKVRAIVGTTMCGALAICNIDLWLSGTPTDLAAAQAWILAADINLTRDVLADRGDVIVYRLGLRGQTIRLNVALHKPVRRPFRVAPIQPPEVA